MWQVRKDRPGVRGDDIYTNILRHELDKVAIAWSPYEMISFTFMCRQSSCTYGNVLRSQRESLSIGGTLLINTMSDAANLCTVSCEPSNFGGGAIGRCRT